MASTTHEVVVLGANFAGLNVTHYLQRIIFPALKRLDSATSYHLTLVSPNTHYFFKIGAPRALREPGAFPQDKLFKPLADALGQYGESCTFVQSKAVELRAAERTVVVESAGGAKKDLKYDSLFICTGTTSADPLWTIHDDHEISEKAVKAMHERLPNTKSVLIAGAGPVGVETAGEIAFKYPEAKVTLVSAAKVLPKQKPGTGVKAKKLLEDAKVEVITDVRVNDTSSNGSSTTISLSDGSSKTVDMFIDARGASKINSDFLPKSWLDQAGRIITRDGYFRVKGDGQADVDGIYVLGDIVSGSDNTAIELDPQVVTGASSFAVDVVKKLGKSPGGSGGLLSFIPGFGGSPLAQKEFKPMKDTILVPVGPNGGVGQIMGYGAPSFMVKKAKSEKFLVNLVDPAISGSKFGKA